MNEYTFTVIIEPQPEGEYLVSVPALPGCYTEGQTLDKARTMAADASRAKQDGLGHISKIADHYVRDPFAVGSVGDVVNVTVIGVDLERGRIGLRLQE